MGERAFDTTVTFQRMAEGRTALNEPVAAGWANIVTVAAYGDPVRDGERATAAQVQREISHRFTTHWSARLWAFDLTEQLVHEGQAYDLVERKPIGRRRRIEWSCLARPVEA